MQQHNRSKQGTPDVQKSQNPQLLLAEQAGQPACSLHAVPAGALQEIGHLLSGALKAACSCLACTCTRPMLSAAQPGVDSSFAEMVATTIGSVEAGALCAGVQQRMRMWAARGGGHDGMHCGCKLTSSEPQHVHSAISASPAELHEVLGKCDCSHSLASRA